MTPQDDADRKLVETANEWIARPFVPTDDLAMFDHTADGQKAMRDLAAALSRRIEADHPSVQLASNPGVLNTRPPDEPCFECGQTNFARVCIPCNPGIETTRPPPVGVSREEIAAVLQRGIGTLEIIEKATPPDGDGRHLIANAPETIGWLTTELLALLNPEGRSADV